LQGGEREYNPRIKKTLPEIPFKNKKRACIKGISS